jgi:hypothetical protein
VVRLKVKHIDRAQKIIRVELVLLPTAQEEPAK